MKFWKGWDLNPFPRFISFLVICRTQRYKWIIVIVLLEMEINMFFN